MPQNESEVGARPLLLKATRFAPIQKGSRAGQRLCDPEEAAVCALFRSFGRFVIALYRYESYGRIRALSIEERINDNQAAVRVLGLSFDRLGVELLNRSSFPQRILLALAPCPEPTRFNTNVEVRLQILSTFCMELALGLWEANLTARRQAIETLLHGFGPGCAWSAST